PANERPWRLLAHVEDEIEPRGKRVPRLGRSHHQLADGQAVAPAHRLLREIELGREHALLRRLHLDVIVAGTADIERRQYRAEAESTLRVREQVPAIAESAVVVLAAFVGVPEIDQRLRQRPAGAG